MPGRHATGGGLLMGSNVRRWLADRLPQDLSSGERLVALEVADLVWDETRQGYGDEFMAKLLQRTGYETEKQIGKVLGKLGVRGIELRVPVRKRDGELARNAAGQLMFAVRGHRRTFRVPSERELRFSARKVPDWQSIDYSDRSPAGGTYEAGSTDSSPAGETKDGVSSPARGTNGVDSSPAGDPLVPRAGDPTSYTSSTTYKDFSSEVAEEGPAETGDDPDAHAPQQQDEARSSVAASKPRTATSRKPKTPRKPKQQELRPDVEQVCKHFAAVLKAGGTPNPIVTDKWRTDIRLLIDRDGITPEQAMRAIDWAHTDGFWQAFILSPAKLREKYDQLRRAAKSKASRSHAPKQDDRDMWDETKKAVIR